MCAFIVFLCYMCTLCVFLQSFWYCWLGLLTCKTVSQITYTVFGGDVKPCSINHWIQRYPAAPACTVFVQYAWDECQTGTVGNGDKYRSYLPSTTSPGSDKRTASAPRSTTPESRGFVASQRYVDHRRLLTRLQQEITSSHCAVWSNYTCLHY